MQLNIIGYWMRGGFCWYKPLFPFYEALFKNRFHRLHSLFNGYIKYRPYLVWIAYLDYAISKNVRARIFENYLTFT